MASDLYVITGATGNIGNKISEILLANKKKIRVVGRRADRLKGFVDKGPEPFVGSLDNCGGNGPGLFGERGPSSR